MAPARPTAEVARAKVVSPPAWIAPPHNVLPGIAPVQLIVARTDETVAADAGSADSETLAEAAFRDERLEHGAEVAVGETAESPEKPDWPVGAMLPRRSGPARRTRRRR
jgi:kynureninase